MLPKLRYNKLNRKMKMIKSAICLAEKWCKDQSIGIPEMTNVYLNKENSYVWKKVYVEGCHECFAHHEKSIACLTVDQHWCALDKTISYPKMREAVWNNSYPEECLIKNGLTIKIK